MSDVKNRVVAKVTNREYVPTRVVELRPDQAVVDQLKPEWWKSAEGRALREPGPLVATDLHLEQDPPEKDVLEALSEMAATDVGKSVVLNGDVIDDLPEPSTEDYKAAVPDDFDAFAHLPKAAPTLFEQLVSGENILVGDKIVPKSVYIVKDNVKPPDAGFAEGRFLMDFSEELHQQLETILHPDVRVIRNNTGQIQSTASSAIAKWLEPAQDPYGENAVVNGTKLRPYQQRVMDDIMAAYELGLPVQAYRWINNKVAEIEAYVSASRDRAIRESVQKAVQTVHDNVMRSSCSWKIG